MKQQWCEDVQQGALVVTVNQRLSRHLNKRYQQFRDGNGDQWWETPAILPLNAWLKTLHAALVSNGFSEHTLMPNLVQARLWRRILIEDEQAPHLLDTEPAAQNALKAWRTAQAYRCQSSDDGVDQIAFGRWAKSYKTYCHKHTLIDEATLADHIISKLDECAAAKEASHPLANALPEKLLLGGFLIPTAQMQTLFDKLEALGVTLLAIQPQGSASVRRHVYADDNVLLQSIAAAVQEKLDAGLESTLGVVVHDLQQRRADVLSSFDNVFFPGLNPSQIKDIGRPYDISAGLPLSEQPVIRTALLLLKLKLRGLNSTELSSLLMSPYSAGGVSDKRQREALDRKCRNDRVHKVTLNSLILLLPKDNSLRRSLEKVSRQRVPSSAGSALWAEHFSTTLKTLQWPGKGLDSEEFQTVEAWRAVLDDLQALDDGEKANHADAFKQLRRLCIERPFQLDTPATPIQIMGRLESHGIEFDELWITGMDAEQWPPIAQPTSFLSVQQQIAAGVPDACAQSRLALAEKEFALWSTSVAQLHVCHAQARDGMPLLPASIVADIEAQPTADAAPSGLLNTISLIRASAGTSSIDDENGPAIEMGSEVLGGARLLENQARCPFKAFALHRLNIKPLEETGIGLDARQHGILLHKSLELFWKDVKTQAKLLDMDEESLTVKLETVVDAALDDAKTETNLRGLQRRYLLRLIGDWIEKVEKRRPAFTVIEFEGNRQVEIAGVKIKLQVDRVDRLDTGETIMIDYKTGLSSTVKSWSDERIASPQLPLYAHTDEQVKGVCFAQVFPNKHQFIGITAEKNLMSRVSTGEKNFPNWEAWRTHWSEALNAIATEVQQGVATITPDKEACRFCELGGLCRIEKTVLEDSDSILAADESETPVGAE